MTGESGVLISPNYPGLYPINIECIWTIRAPERSNIRLTFTDFNLEEFNQYYGKCYDYVEVGSTTG